MLPKMALCQLHALIKVQLLDPSFRSVPRILFVVFPWEVLGAWLEFLPAGFPKCKDGWGSQRWQVDNSVIRDISLTDNL